jgi:hypothetical protein
MKIFYSLEEALKAGFDVAGRTATGYLVWRRDGNKEAALVIEKAE